MAHLHRSVASLRISGHDLDPSAIAKSLGCEPTLGYRRGDVIIGSKTGSVRKFGMWLLEASDRQPEDLDGQIAEMLGRLTPSLEIWRNMATQYDLDLFCGLFMRETNEGLTIAPTSLAALAARGIELGLDIYSPIRKGAGAHSED